MAVLCKTPSGHYPVAMAAAHPHPNFLLPRRDKSLDFAMTFYQSRELVYVNCRFKIALVGQGQKKWYSCYQVVSMRETSTLTLQKLQIVSLLDTATTIIDKWNPPKKIGGFTSFQKTKWWKLEDILKKGWQNMASTTGFPYAGSDANHPAGAWSRLRCPFTLRWCADLAVSWY